MNIKNNLTIVIPSKNESRTLYDCVYNISKQTNINGTRIIISDVSDTYDSLFHIRDLIRDFSHLLDIEVIKGGYPSEARFNGSILVNTPYMLFLDADVFLTNPIMLEECLKHHKDLIELGNNSLNSPETTQSIEAANKARTEATAKRTQEDRDALNEAKQNEADDLNIQITDAQLKAYIERFDQIRSTSKVTEKDIFKYTLSQLIRIVTSSKGVEEPEEEINITPDVVYNENGLTIYNGSKENNCLTFGAGESWCITRGSFGNYRYDSNRKNPTFYLVKDTNLPASDKKSFFVVVVGNDNTYKASDRSNNDVGGRATEWDRWEGWSFVESNFPSVRGLKNIFKYIPLSNTEKVNQTYKNNPISIREWIKLPFDVKKQYLVVRKDKGDLFKDIENDTFVEKYLPKYPQIANFIATNAGIISSIILTKNLEKFSNQDVKSIIANMRDKIELKYLATDDIPFEVKKFLVQSNKWDVPSTERLYVTKDGSTIVKLKLGDNISVGIYQAEDDYPNVKLNKRTSKYLLDYPELDKIPLKNLSRIEFVNQLILRSSYTFPLVIGVFSSQNSKQNLKRI